MTEPGAPVAVWRRPVDIRLVIMLLGAMGFYGAHDHMLTVDEARALDSARDRYEQLQLHCVERQIDMGASQR